MTSQEVKRKLTTILSADVKGYSRLMGEDEEWTVRTLKGYKEVMGNLVQQHRGRVVDAIGDNLMAEFASVVDAVQSGVEIQQALRAKNALLPETRRVEFRIGINLGDVIEEGERIYGDGVNIAARLEGLAEAGGICISESAYQQVENKLPLRYEDLGEHQFKNIAKPIRVYRAQIEPEAVSEKKAKPGQWRRSAIGLVAILIVVVAALVIWKLYTPPVTKVEVASKEKMAFPLPDKPSIAVLPFVNMSEDPKQDPISDGMTEEIINALSKVPEVFVIARNSTFVYKGKATDVRQVAEALGVQYILEGSVRMSGDTVRVTAQLIDAINGHHLWSERYDRSVKDVFALQDEITMRILTELRVKLTHSEGARILERGTNNLQAYLKVVEGGGYFRQYNREANVVAMRLYREALELDPKYAMAYSHLSTALTNSMFYGASESPKEDLSNALKLAEKAVELDRSSAEAHAAVSYVLLWMHQFDKALEFGERAVRLNPNSSAALFALGNSLTSSWRGEEALPLLRQAIRLNPFFAACYMVLGTACHQTGRYEEGIAAEKKALKLAPNSVFTNIYLVGLYMYAGREDEARAAAAEVQRIDPNFSLEKWSKSWPMKEGPQRDRLIDAMRKAGLK
ncbi:MAG: adenylate/guanylate cyclase domain-containing protein [Syntrophales bacterium]|jgi:adenylate cyclase